MPRNGIAFIVIFSFLLSACSQVTPAPPTSTPRPTRTLTPTPTSVPTLTTTPTITPPQLIEVQGRKLSIQCLGSGSPVVILEAGLGVYSGTWYKVAPEVARFTKVCAYDRFGLGLSEPALTPRTSDHMVTELHELLTKAGLPSPYILVGHSFAGLNIHLFASTYPEEVAGLVFVDAIHPDLDVRIEQILSPAQLRQRRDELKLNQEGIRFEDILASEDQVRAAGPVPDVPIIVIRHGLPFEGDANWPSAQVEALWEELQNDLAALTSDSEVIVAGNSHHRIQEDRPDVVIEAIRAVFNKVQKP